MLHLVRYHQSQPLCISSVCRVSASPSRRSAWSRCGQVTGEHDRIKCGRFGGFVGKVWARLLPRTANPHRARPLPRVVKLVSNIERLVRWLTVEQLDEMGPEEFTRATWYENRPPKILRHASPRSRADTTRLRVEPQVGVTNSPDFGQPWPNSPALENMGNTQHQEAWSGPCRAKFDHCVGQCLRFASFGRTREVNLVTRGSQDREAQVRGIVRACERHLGDT